MAKHGLTNWERNKGETNSQYGARLALQIKDKRAFLIDLWSQIQLSDQGNALRNELTDVKINGDQLGQGHFGRQEGKTRQFQTVEFRKIAGSCRLETPGIGH